MVDQLERLLEIEALPNVRLGIIPIDRQLQAFTSASVNIIDGEVARPKIENDPVTNRLVQRHDERHAGKRGLLIICARYVIWTSPNEADRGFDEVQEGRLAWSRAGRRLG